MFDYKSEALAYSISLENAEMRESLLKQELLATQISLENAEADTKRLEWALPLLTGSSGAEDDAKTNALVIQLIAGKDGREAIDGAMAARAAA